MSIVILKGNQQQQWDIDGSMKPGGIPVHFTEVQVEKHKDSIERILDDEVKKPEEKKEETEIKKLTEKEAFALNKAEQVKLLNEFGITKIPLLEKGRVKAILEAQK